MRYFLILLLLLSVAYGTEKRIRTQKPLKIGPVECLDVQLSGYDLFSAELFSSDNRLMGNCWETFSCEFKNPTGGEYRIEFDRDVVLDYSQNDDCGDYGVLFNIMMGIVLFALFIFLSICLTALG